MTRALVLVAVDLEARGLARRLGLSAVRGAGWPHYQGGVLEIVGIGVGARCLGARISHLPRPDLVISAGACGGLAPSLEPGQLVVPERVLDADGSGWPTAVAPGLGRHGTLLSVGALVSEPSEKARLYLRTGALAADMESAAILRWAAGRGIPAAVVRGVSDAAARGVPRDLAATVDADGRVRALAAVRAALARPRAVRDAMELRAGMAAALATVARALGRVAAAVKATASGAGAAAPVRRSPPLD